MFQPFAHPLSIVLVEPQQPGNIGMVCRAMANFGVEDLRLVNPCDHLHPEARKFAVAGNHLLGKAQIFCDLASALADTALSLAATRRQGRLRGELVPSNRLQSLVEGLPGQARVALVFGREDHGLTSGELSLCSAGVRIVTNEPVGSLNLAQAVLALLYELHRDPWWTTHVQEASRQPASHGELEPMLQQMEQLLDRIGFGNPSCPGTSFHRLRRLFYRARPDAEEVGLLRSLWGQLWQSVHDWPGRRRGG